MQVTATTYDELRKYVQAFKTRTYNVLFIIGSPGHSKSTIVRQVLPGARRICGGNVTPFQLYRELWDHRDKDFVIDDVEQLWRDPALVQLLKALCETEQTKTVMWTTASRQLEQAGIDTEFETKSRVVIILNEWDDVSQHIQSLEDRGLMVHFRPSTEEVLKLGRTFVKDRQVLNFVEENRPYIDRLSLRALMIAAGMKKEGLPWREPLKQSLGIAEIMLVKEIEEDKSLITEKARIDAWTQRTRTGSRPGKSRSTYYAYRRRKTELDLAYRRPHAS